VRRQMKEKGEEPNCKAAGRKAADLKRGRDPMRNPANGEGKTHPGKGVRMRTRGKEIMKARHKDRRRSESDQYQSTKNGGGREEKKWGYGPGKRRIVAEEGGIK